LCFTGGTKIINLKTKLKTMETGTVKWFNRTKGYGFIEPSNGEKDVFIHISELEKQGIYDLKEEQKISYEIENNKGKQSATNIQLID
jgi:CspA family cold shock protein